MANTLRNRVKQKSSDSLACTSHSTPVKSYSEADKDYSPLFVPFTQESLENVEVLWDWNSPQSKTKIKKKPKRIINIAKSSPKLQIRKVNRYKNASFDKIREELQAYQQKICIPQSPPMEFDDIEGVRPLNNNNGTKFNDVFDDSLEHDLILVSQQVEEKLKEKGVENIKCAHIAITLDKASVKQPWKCNTRALVNTWNSNECAVSPEKSPNNFNYKLDQLNMDDSLDFVLESLDERALYPNEKTHAFESPKQNGPAAGSAYFSNKPGDNGALKLKTKSLSFGDSYKRKDEASLKDEIEKKRLAALAKLRSKKAALPPILSDSDTSPVKCSPDEIELKRQQARARLEQKKTQELIEKKRQEALKRLAMNRKKRGQ